MIRDAAMDFRMPSGPQRRFRLHRGLFVLAFVFVAALLIAVQAFFPLPSGSIAIIGLLLFLPLVLLAALGVGRGLLTPSLKELAFYFFAMTAAAAIWPGARLAISTYKNAGFVALAAFMIFVFALAVALALLSAHFLARSDEDS